MIPILEIEANLKGRGSSFRTMCIVVEGLLLGENRSEIATNTGISRASVHRAVDALRYFSAVDPDFHDELVSTIVSKVYQGRGL